MAADERLPEHDADGPHVRSAAGVFAGQALGRDVGERSGHVARCRQRLRLAHLRKPEVEDPDGDLGGDPVWGWVLGILLDQHHVRGLHITVDDALAVGVAQRVEHLRTCFHGGGVVERAAAESLAERSSGDELVGDVDVPLVSVEGERPEAARVAQPGRRLHLPLRSRPSLAFSRDDLECDVARGRLVSHEPDRTGPAAAQRPQGSVAAEDEPSVKGTGFTEGGDALHYRSLGPDA
jgi:hypothetical protein